jgi:hypothetical protein
MQYPSMQHSPDGQGGSGHSLGGHGRQKPSTQQNPGPQSPGEHGAGQSVQNPSTQHWPAGQSPGSHAVQGTHPPSTQQSPDSHSGSQS